MSVLGNKYLVNIIYEQLDYETRINFNQVLHPSIRIHHKFLNRPDNQMNLLAGYEIRLVMNQNYVL